MDLSKLKDSKILKWGLIIALPTVLVAGYYGYKYYKDKKGKKENESENENGNEIEKETKVGADSEVDKNDEFEYHKIVLPTSPQKELNLINVLKAKDIKYKLLGIKTVSGIRNEPILEYNVGIDKNDFEQFEKIVNDIKESLNPKEKEVENS
jgi:H+/gluconate symporter-like permease